MGIGKVSLQHKVLLGYMILIVVVCSVVSILLYERSRMRAIRTETLEIRRIRHDVNTAHRHITELATDGESVIAYGQSAANIEIELWHVCPARTN